MADREKPLSLKLLGSPHILRDGKVVTLGTRKSLALIAYLAVQRSAVQRDTLDNLLWPESDTEKARRNLRSEIARIHRFLGDNIVLSESQALRINAAEINVDLWELNGVLKQGNTTRLIDLYKGNLLEGFYLKDSEVFESWLEEERENLQNSITETLEVLVKRSDDTNQFAKALKYSKDIIKLDRLNEDVYLAAIRYAVILNDRIGGLSIYQELEHMLAKEFNFKPSEEAQLLAQKLRESLVNVQPIIDTSIDKPAQLVPVNNQEIAHNIPVTMLPFFGREKELSIIINRLSLAECRLLTVIGLGGVGKTRLAREVAKQALETDHFSSGVWWVSLVAITGTYAIYFAIAKALSLELDKTSSIEEQLLNRILDKNLLIILDNFEHLLDDDLEPVRVLLNKAKKLKLLITSRQPLNINEEYLFEVSSFPLPEKINLESTYENIDAIKLFCYAAKRANHSFALNHSNRDDVFRICQILDGLPLAIELAAARLRSLSCQDIANELEHDFDFLHQAYSKDMKNKSLKLIFEQAWSRLKPEEQRVLCGLSILRGKFTRDEALETVGGNFTTLTGLVEASLIKRSPPKNYQIVETIRRYAFGKLDLYPEFSKSLVQARSKVVEKLVN